MRRDRDQADRAGRIHVPENVDQLCFAGPAAVARWYGFGDRKLAFFGLKARFDMEGELAFFAAVRRLQPPAG
jgi:hypothetical protein